MNDKEQPIRYDDIDRHEITFLKHPVKGKKKRVRRMKDIEIRSKEER
jgi:hypothetical protein